MKRLIAAISLMTAAASLPAQAEEQTWQSLEAMAKGQTVYFHAWGGEPRINAYLQWAADEVEARNGVKVVHVKISETATAVSQILAEKSAGKTEGGAIDLLWVNGENFASMKKHDLLAEKGWAQNLPNWALVDVQNKPTVLEDFTVPTDGQESPWGMAKLVFMHDTTRLETPPSTLEDLLAFARANPGRFAYPQPPNFFGTTFLKQVLVSTIEDTSALSAPVDPTSFETQTAPMFAYLDELHPRLWRQGIAFPKNAAHMRQLLADSEVDIAFSFNPGDASAAIANGELPPSVRTFVLDGGTLGNTHFVAIPFNSSVKEGAKVFANFLLSAEAQLRKQDPGVWGDPTVLSMAALNEQNRAAFDAQDLGPATLNAVDLGPVLPEPHPSWVAALETAWGQRYGAGKSAKTE